MHDGESSGSFRIMIITSSKGALISLGQTITSIYNWHQCLEKNYDNRIVIYKENMAKLFKTIPTLLPPKKLYNYKTKYQTTIKAVGQ